jgi:gluconolactonase
VSAFFFISIQSRHAGGHVEITVVARDLGFIEGPLWSTSGTVFVASISHGCVYEINGDGQRLGKRETGGGPNGLACYGDDVLVAQNGGIFGASGQTKGGIQRLTKGSSLPLLFERAFTAPNDLCVAPDGRLFVSDPLTERALLEPVLGRLVACDLETGEYEVIADDKLFPNGLAFDPSGEILYLAQTYPRVIERFSVRGNKVASLGILCTMKNGRPDGIAVDMDGNLWVCTPGTGGVEVHSPSGQLLDRIEIGAGAMTTNCCFGGDDMSDLFVTASGWGSLLRLRTSTQGLPLFRGTAK